MFEENFQLHQLSVIILNVSVVFFAHSTTALHKEPAEGLRDCLENRCFLLLFDLDERARLCHLQYG